jgi:hypothetical protein
MPATGLLNEAMQDLKATLTAVTGLRVVSDPTKIVPNCVFIDAPSFTTFAGNGNILNVTFPIKVLGSGPASLPVLRQLLDTTAKVISSNVIVMNGQPTAYLIGGAEYPCYDLVVSVQAQTA